MRSFREFYPKLAKLSGVALAIVAAGWAVAANGALPTWLRNIDAGSALERAFFRAMPLPEGEVLFPRPPAEARTAMTDLLKQRPNSAELYSLRALADEQQLDFASAEADWKLYAEKSSNRIVAQLSLADFYHRRLRPLDEIAALNIVAEAPPDAAAQYIPAEQQRSWQAFERIFRIIRAQGLAKESSLTEYRAWIARYPKEDQLYSRFLDYLVAEKEFAAANQLVAEYQRQFPSDDIFPVKAHAMVAYRGGSLEQGLGVYQKSFQPLWSPELVKSYFDLLAQTQSLRKFLDQARAALQANPEDLNAAARVFYYYQQQGKLDIAQQSLTNFRLHKELAKSSWTLQELFVCARLSQDIHSYPEAARYYFALYSLPGSPEAQERGLSGLTNLLLTAPEAPIRLGTGELSLYKDIATMDQGPGYLNGILSLILNSTGPENEYSAEEQRSVSYFHRARAAELLALLDTKFPNSANRPELHAKLLEFYASSGQSEAVLKGGKEFLAAFPKADQRTSVSLLMADADARLGKSQDEFAIYDAVLQELAAKSGKVPLGPRDLGLSQGVSGNDPGASDSGAKEERNEPEQPGEDGQNLTLGQVVGNPAFQAIPTNNVPQAGARSQEYSRVLERYLARLVQRKEIPQALAVLRREIDHNPDDPGLYERLAVFLEQNHLGTEQEEVYRRAIARFPNRSWYNQLARYYLRYKRDSEFENLTRQAVKSFDGSDLQSYFQSVVGGTPDMYLRLNEYALSRFPHNSFFVNNLLSAYHSRPTWNQPAWEALIRKHWFEDLGLRNRFFEFLSSSGKLDTELLVLQQTAPPQDKGTWAEFVRQNPAAGNFIAEAQLWGSHFEASAPVLKALAEEYPAAIDLDRTASSVFRSLAYLDPSDTSVAVQIEKNLLSANPRSTETLARIGDIYADRDLFTEAAPYWERIPQVSPGESGGYLDAATIYWDYFDFDNALRLLNEGRRKLGSDALYGYEEGAIYEGKRDYAHAIQQYAQAALAGDVNSPAAERLLSLSRRAQYRELVDRESQRLAATTGFSLPAISLRVRVLNAENRKSELGPFLENELNKATTMEEAASMESLAQVNALESVRERALEKQATLASDPVTRLQLRYALVRLYESHKDFAAAQRNVETLYRENPKILGVVRSTVDFYWRVKLYPQAIGVLDQSAKDAYPQLAKQFTFEAVRKSTESRQYEHARQLLQPLLKESPYDAQYLSAMADTYGQAGDQQGLKQFYLEEIAAFRTAPLSADQRKSSIATLRRGLIPALTRLNDYAGGVDQYIELLNAYPEDDGLATEAALYALRYKRESQLVDFYAKTVQQSPRDYRWAMVLGSIQTSLEKFPAAIDAYGKAITIRPDRPDLRIARAAIYERLLQFDEAAIDYERLYQLSYKDPKWMEKIAEVRARQGRPEEVVTALKTALIDGVPERPENYFEVARRLEGWGLLPQARDFAEQGANAAGGELLASAQYHAGAKLYTRVLTRLHQQDKAYATLHTALISAAAALPVIKEQVAKQGIAAITDKEWRERQRQLRIDTARNGLRISLGEMGSVVSRYFTPEEKSSFEEFAQSIRTPMDVLDTVSFAIALVQSAGLAEVEARWRYEVMINAPDNATFLLGQMSSFVQLQRQRLKFAELGPQLERFAPRVTASENYRVYLEAANAYRAASDTRNELRVLTSLPPAYLGGDLGKRYFTLLLNQRPEQLVQVASQWTSWGEEAAEFAIANGDAALAQSVVAARARTQPPVWKKSYTALVGLYFAEATPNINSAFVDALGDRSIGERLGKPVNREAQLAGDVWYYYGSRYGEYLGDTKQGTPEDFLASELEQSPASPAGYESLADYYAEGGDAQAAIADYNHVLELAPRRADVHDRLAMLYYKQGARAEAIAQWKLFFVALQRQADSSSAPESFAGDFGRVCAHLQARHLFAELKPAADSVVRAYLRNNGNYRSNTILRSAYLAFADPAAATPWLIEVASAAQDPATVLSDIVDAPWIPLAKRGLLYQRILEEKQNNTPKAEGYEKEYAESTLLEWKIRWIKYLVQSKQFAQAQDYLATLPSETRIANATALVPLQLQIAARLDTLDSLISGYRSDPLDAPSPEVLRAAAQQLFKAGDKQSARKILEHVFAREIEEHHLVAANFLGLAELRLASGDTPGALDLLRRLVLVVDDPYQDMDSSAALLEKTGHYAEALEFLGPLVKTTPWDSSFRLRLAKDQIATKRDVGAAQDSLVKLASTTENSYALRVESAIALANAPPSVILGSGELNLLAGDARSIAPAAANHPYYYDARLQAAQNSADAHVRVEILSQALADLPSRDDARVPLFFSAASYHSDEYALASIPQLLRDPQLRELPARRADDYEEIPSADEYSDEGEDSADPAVAARLLPAQQAQLAWTIGSALKRLNRAGEAIPYLLIAQKLEKPGQRRKEIAAEIANARAQVRRTQQNVQRQPILHKELEQDRLVRPRLLSRATSPAGLPQKAGERP